MKQKTKVLLILAIFFLILVVHGTYNIMYSTSQCATTESYIYIFDFILAGIILFLISWIGIDYCKKNKKNS